MVKLKISQTDIVLVVLDFLRRSGLVQSMRALEKETGLYADEWGKVRTNSTNTSNTSGTAIGTTRMKTEEATIDFLQNQAVSPEVQRTELDLLQRWQRRQLETTGPDQALEGRIESFELAFRMQTEAPPSRAVAWIDFVFCR